MKCDIVGGERSAKTRLHAINIKWALKVRAWPVISDMLSICLPYSSMSSNACHKIVKDMQVRFWVESRFSGSEGLGTGRIWKLPLDDTFITSADFCTDTALH